MKITFLLAFILISINGSAQKLVIRDTIALTINEHNTIFVKAVFNNKDTLNLNFDTGTTELILINDVLKNKMNYETKLYNTFYNLKIGNTNYKTKVYDAELAGHGTEGRLDCPQKVRHYLGAFLWKEKSSMIMRSSLNA